MSGFLSSLASKAQSAYEQSPLSGQVADLQSKLQQRTSGGHAGGSTATHTTTGTGAGATGAGHPTANEAAAQGGYGANSRMLGTLTHQFRSIQMQLASVGPVQRIITTEKSVVLDFDGAARDSKAFSKELYTWGQGEREDLKDVTDRLAYLNFVHGALSETLSQRLDESRNQLKALRDAEKALEPKRAVRAGIQTQIARLEHEQARGAEKRLAELKQQLQRAEVEDDAAEKQVEILKRKAVALSEKAKWEALREYGEKLVLLAEASSPIVSALPPVPPSAGAPYGGAQTTAQTRAALQHALDNYKPGSLSHSFQPSAADLNRSDSRSFGVTHATELSDIASAQTSAGAPHHQSDKAAAPPASPPTTAATPAGQTSPGALAVPVPASSASVTAPSPISATAPSQAPIPVNPASLNNTPTPIPAGSPVAAPAVQTNVLHVNPQDAQAVSAPMPASEPTIAETGVPVSAGADGPGPASGSILDLKAKQATLPPNAGAPEPAPTYDAGIGAPAATASGAGAKFESAEDEKKRLQREERERLLHASGPAPTAAATGSPAAAQKFESAEEEKKRLEKEERERLLKEGGSGPTGGPSDQGGPGNAGAGGEPNPPPYQDF